jgi:tRNA-modifying protein YgfZ
MSDPTSLQALRESAVVLDGASHDILRATGNDRVSFLHRITSGKVAGVETGQGTRTLLLDVRGHVLASLLVFVRAKSVRLIVAGGQGADVVAGLSKFAIMDDFQIVLESELASLAVLGPKAGQALTAVGIPVSPAIPEGPLLGHQDITSEAFGPLWVAHGRASGADGLCVVASRAAREAIREALLRNGTPSLSADVADALRIAALEPAPGKEITPERFPVEVGLGKAIDHSKGCYVGQETIVRMRDRGIIRKRLVHLCLAEGPLPSPSDKIVAEGQTSAGMVTSVGCVPGERPVALAIVASAVPIGAKVLVQHAENTLPAEIVAESAPWG